MNEYLTTFLAEDHRRELLAEARAEALAREALAGRPSWWRRLFTRSAGASTEPTATSVNQPHGRERDDVPAEPAPIARSPAPHPVLGFGRLRTPSRGGHMIERPAAEPSPG